MSGKTSACPTSGNEYHTQTCSNSLVAYRCFADDTYKYKCGCGYGIMYSNNSLATWNDGASYSDEYTKLTVTDGSTTNNYVGIALTDTNGTCKCPDGKQSAGSAHNPAGDNVLKIKNQNYDKVNNQVGCK